MIHEPTTEVEKNHPPSMSASPYNAYYLRGCDIVSRSPSYTSCIYKIEEHAAGRPVTYAEECNAAIRQGRCDAAIMRESENLKGVALFFWPRYVWKNRLITNLTPESELPVVTRSYVTPKPSDNPNAANAAGAYVAYTPKLVKREGDDTKPLPRPSEASTFSDGGFADAINAAMLETFKEASIPVSIPVSTPVSIPVSTPVSTPVSRISMEPGESPLQYARRVAASR